MSFRFRFKVKIEEPTGIFSALNIKVHWCKPRHGQSKRVARSFGDLENHLRARPELAGPWCGSKPDAKPEDYASRAVPIDVFLRVLEEKTIAYNNRGGRRTAIASGRSFQQVWDDSIAAGAPLRKAPAAQLRLCLLAAEEVRVNDRDGCIYLFGNRYGGAIGCIAAAGFNDTGAAPEIIG